MLIVSMMDILLGPWGSRRLGSVKYVSSTRVSYCLEAKLLFKT